jgi:predicted negative regulator of RcsB-dependent stress response
VLSGCSKHLNDSDKDQSPALIFRSSQSIETENTNSSDIISDDNSKQLSPAVLALLADADKSSQQGDLKSAVITLERALRIDSRNPILLYKLAKLRLTQLKPRLAEDLAKKAALLSGKDKTLKHHCWLLISEAREHQNNHFGANEAKNRAKNILDE